MDIVSFRWQYVHHECLPSGLTTNVVLDPTVAALFPAPMVAYFGCQSGNTAGTGQSCVLSNITITGTATPVNDTFKNDATLNTNIWEAQGDPNAVQLIPAATPLEWVKRTVRPPVTICNPAPA